MCRITVLADLRGAVIHWSHVQVDGRAGLPDLHSCHERSCPGVTLGPLAADDAIPQGARL